MELKRQKQVQIEKIRQQTLIDQGKNGSKKSLRIGDSQRNNKTPTCVPNFQNSNLIRTLRPGTSGENLGYRKVLHFKDDQYIKSEKDVHDQILRYYQDYNPD